VLALPLVLLCACATSTHTRVKTPVCTRLQQCYVVTNASLNARAHELLSQWLNDRVNVVRGQTDLNSWTAQNPRPWSPQQQTTYNSLHAQLVFYSHRMVDDADAYNALIVGNKELLNDNSLLPYLSAYSTVP
jgi:hypothetical protein